MKTCAFCGKEFCPAGDSRALCSACLTKELQAWDIIPAMLTVDELRFKDQVIDRPEPYKIPADSRFDMAADKMPEGAGEDQ